MKYLFELSHPKHFYQFRHVMQMLRRHHTVKIIARNKDVLLQLLQEQDLEYEEYGPHGKTLAGKLFVLSSILLTYVKIIRAYKPDVIVSRSSPYAALLSLFFDVSTIVFPDSEVVAINNKLVAPRASMVITPDNFELDFGEKHYRVRGFFENSYLHPDYFTPSRESLKYLRLRNNETYVVLRFVGWHANHDVNQGGFSLEHKEKLVVELSKQARVFISAESGLPSQLQKYQLNMPASRMHDILHFASLYIGDSQTMATEAALLGTPAIRCNSFVGENDMSNFRLLENKHQLLFNYSSFDDVLTRAVSVLRDPQSKETWQKRRRDYFAETTDMNKQVLDLLKGSLG